jgi:hypothetical protein
VSNYFQASFQLTEGEFQPGARFASQTFFNSMSVSSLSGIYYQGGTGSSSGTGGVYPDDSGWWMTFQINDFGHGTEMLVSDSILHEKPFSGPDMFFETGYWTYLQIPEPSAFALCGVGIMSAFCAARRRRRFEKPPPAARSVRMGL